MKQIMLVLEHDWKLIEDKETKIRLLSGKLLDNGFSCVRHRHRATQSFSHFSFQYHRRELDYYDKEIEVTSPHLLDSVHWCNPEKFPQHIQREGEYFITTSRYGNWTTILFFIKKIFI